MDTDGAASSTPQTPSAAPAAPPVTLFAAQPGAATLHIERGTCYVFFAYDIGLAIDLNEAERRITEMTQREIIRHKRRAPRFFAFQPPPLRVTQTAEPIAIGGYRTAPVVDTVIYDFGAVSVAYSLPLAGPFAGLLALCEDLYDNAALLADSRRRVELLLKTIAPAVAKANISELVEDYTIYQLEELRPAAGAGRIGAQPLEIAQILRSQQQPLSQQEIDDVLACRLSYAADDLTIIDWNAALILDREADDVRAVLEFANVEMLELRFLDDQLDDALDQAYKTLFRRSWGQRLFKGNTPGDLRKIAELQVDSALLFEGVNNALKLLGDQYLARVYRLASQRLHLNEWDASILRKLQTLESIYQKMSDRQSKARMEVLEWIIILLIAGEIVLSLLSRRGT